MHCEVFLADLLSQLDVVLDLAVIRDPVAEFIAHRLLALLDVDDAPPAVGEADVPTAMSPRAGFARPAARGAVATRSSPQATTPAGAADGRQDHRFRLCNTRLVHILLSNPAFETGSSRRFVLDSPYDNEKPTSGNGRPRSLLARIGHYESRSGLLTGHAPDRRPASVHRPLRCNNAAASPRHADDPHRLLRQGAPPVVATNSIRGRRGQRPTRRPIRFTVEPQCSQKRQAMRSRMLARASPATGRVDHPTKEIARGEPVRDQRHQPARREGGADGPQSSRSAPGCTLLCGGRRHWPKRRMTPRPGGHQEAGLHENLRPLMALGWQRGELRSPMLRYGGS